MVIICFSTVKGFAYGRITVTHPSRKLTHASRSSVGGDRLLELLCWRTMSRRRALTRPALPWVSVFDGVCGLVLPPYRRLGVPTATQAVPPSGFSGACAGLCARRSLNGPRQSTVSPNTKYVFRISKKPLKEQHWLILLGVAPPRGAPTRRRVPKCRILLNCEAKLSYLVGV